MKDMRDEVLEIADIARSCPENLQTICFEVLLKHFLAGATTTPTPRTEIQHVSQNGAGLDQSAVSADPVVPRQDDIRETDLHVKVKRLMEREGVSISRINELFYKEDDRILPLFEDLKSTRTAQCQVRIALLQSLVNAFDTGEFEADVEQIRQECIRRKCYDVGHFTENFRNSRNWFDFERFDKDVKVVRLSELGKKALAELIKELD